MGAGRVASLKKNVNGGVVFVKANSSPEKITRQPRRASMKSKVSTVISYAKAEASSTFNAIQQQETLDTVPFSTRKQREMSATTQGSTISEKHFKRAKTCNMNLEQQAADELNHQACPSNGQNSILSGEFGHSFPSASGALSMELQVEAENLQKTAKEASVVNCGQTLQSCAKLKLQLFPINEFTLKGLEKDEHNPHLELTLSARKKISSVVKHLNCKWGDSSVALGELMLFPFNISVENVASYRRWTLGDTETTVEDVYVTIGSPAIFRLRYGWFSNLESRTFLVPFKSPKDYLHSKDIQKGCKDKRVVVGDEQTCSEVRVVPVDQSVEDMGIQRIGDALTLSLGSWADCLTNISMGSLLTEGATRTADVNNCNSAAIKGDSCLRQIPFSCDSFDAAIAAHISDSRGRGTPTQVSCSILDAEETCHAFPFQMAGSSREAVPSSSLSASFGPVTKNVRSNTARSSDPVEVRQELQLTKDNACQVEPTANSQSHSKGPDNAVDNSTISDLSWNDSLGPFDFGLLSSSRQIVSGDSISLSGLFASSLDAFQNSSLFTKHGTVPFA